MTRERFQELLWDYLYDLLDAEGPDSKAAFERALQDDAGCRELLSKAQAHKALLSVAAKQAAPEEFNAPVNQPEPKRAALPLAHRKGVGFRFALAASVVLALLAAGGTPVYLKDRELRDRQELAAAELKSLQTKRAEALALGTQVAEARQQAELALRQLSVKQATAAQQLRTKLTGENFYLTVAKPAIYEAGAPYTLLVNTRSLADQPVPTVLEVKVFGADHKELAVPAERIVTKEARPGVHEVSLPPDLNPTRHPELAIEIVAKDPKGLSAKVSERLKLFSSFFVTHVVTDKPMYQPGETVWFRSLTLERFSLKPAGERLNLSFALTDGKGQKVHEEQASTDVVDKAGKVVNGPNGQPLRGLGCGSFRLPPDCAGGEYTLTVSEGGGRFPAEQRKFIVNRFEKPQLKKELEWNRKSYGAGDAVAAACKVSAAAGGKPLAAKPVLVTISIDGAAYGPNGQRSSEPIRLVTDEKGEVLVRFKLPAQMEKGQGSLAVNFSDGANIETLLRPIPIVLNKVFLGLFPEGGDLVAGVPNRVYFQARTPSDKPAELKARLVDEAGAVVATLETFADDKEPGANQGVGLFRFTPTLGAKYTLKIDAPAGAVPETKIPEAKAEGVVLSIAEGVGQAGGPIQATLTNVGPARNLIVGAYCRGRALDQQPLRLEPNQTATVALKTLPEIGGVLRVTTFEEQQSATTRKLIPVAERLVFRGAAKRLDVKLAAQRKSYIPGEKATLRVETLDEGKKAAGSILMLSVVDKNLLTLADEKTARSMPTHFLLTSEVRKPEELEHADFLLTDHPKAPQALDLLLGTQGWRRFAEQNPEQFKQKNAEDAAALLARQGQELAPEVQTTYAEVVARMEKQLALEAELLGKPLLAEKVVATEKLERATQEFANFRQGEQAGLLQKTPALIDIAQRRLTAAANAYVEYRTKVLPVGALFALGLLVMGLSLCLGTQRGLLLYGLGLLAGLGVLGASVWFVLGVQDEAKPTFQAVGQALQDPVSFNVEGAAGKGEQGGGDRGGAAVRPVPGAPLADRAELDAPMDRAMPGPGGADRMPAVRGRVPARPGAPPGNPVPPLPAPAPAMMLPMAPAKAEDAPAVNAIAPNQKGDALNFPATVVDGVNKKVERFQVPNPLGGKGELAEEAKKAKNEPLGAARRDAGRLEEANRPLGKVGFAHPMGGGGGGRGGEAGTAAGAGIQFVKPDGSLSKVETGYRQASLPPTIVREYAHQRSLGASTVRNDWTDTLLWQPVAVAPDGTVNFTFDLSDSVTTFEALAFAHTPDGRLGAGKLTFEAKLPFHVEPKLPTEITATDEMHLPVAVTNGTEGIQKISLSLRSTLLTLEGPAERSLDVAGESLGRAVYKLKALASEGQGTLDLLGRSDNGLSDTMQRTLRIVPDGFPIVESHSGQLQELASHELTLPPSFIKGTLHLQATAYPSTLADLQQGLEGMLREPSGCFEQTSSTSYPNTLILDYLNETKQTKPEIERRARELLERGYGKLIGFECFDPTNNKRGYEWFGGRAAPHEALTAYGLLQFTDMARLRPVDAEMLRRTRDYLLAQRDGQGGFKRNPRALDRFGGAPQEVTNAYIVWSLTESGTKEDLTPELMALKQAAAKANDPYFLALVANSLLNAGQANEGRDLLRKLADMQAGEGWLQGASTSITGSGGRDLQVETTALALLAWMKVEPPGEFTAPVNKAIKWLTSQRGGYGAFGSTQSTILALKALIAFAKKNVCPIEDGELILLADGQELGKVAFTAKAQDAIELRVADAERLLKPGTNKLRLLLTGKNSFPYTLRWSYQTVTPPSADGCPLSLATTLAKTKLNEGDAVRLLVKVKNVSGKGQGMAVAIVGLPAGLTLPEDMKQLKDHARLRDDDTKPGLIAAWETRGRDVILYWRGLAPDQEIEVPIDLTARVPGKYRGPASRAYLYYNADAKRWVEPLAVEIQAK